MKSMVMAGSKWKHETQGTKKTPNQEESHFLNAHRKASHDMLPDPWFYDPWFLTVEGPRLGDRASGPEALHGGNMAVGRFGEPPGFGRGWVGRYGKVVKKA
jgi:hypothetical protein